jgi:hypothetical protein
MPLIVAAYTGYEFLEVAHPRSSQEQLVPKRQFVSLKWGSLASNQVIAGRDEDKRAFVQQTNSGRNLLSSLSVSVRVAQ